MTKKKRQKNRFKPISKNQIIVKLDLKYIYEDKGIDLRGERYYLVKNFKEIKNKRLKTELLAITTKSKDKWFELQSPIKKLPNCLPNASFANHYLLVILKLKETKYRRYLCSECSRFCLDSEEFTEIINEHKKFWKKNSGQPFLKTIDLEI